MPVIPRILVVAGSIRSGAFSASTADAAMQELARQGADVTRVSLADYPLPIMDQDLEKENGVPQNAVRLARQIAAHDGLLSVTRQTRLLAKSPALDASIRLRLPYIEPLNLLQVELLKRHRAGEADPRIAEGIQLSINAIATALRNLCALSRDVVIVVVPFLQELHWEETSYGDYWRPSPFALQRLFAENGFELVHLAYNENPTTALYLFCIASRQAAKWAGVFPPFRLSRAGSYPGMAAGRTIHIRWMTPGKALDLDGAVDKTVTYTGKKLVVKR